MNRGMLFGMALLALGSWTGHALARVPAVRPELPPSVPSSGPRDGRSGDILVCDNSFIDGHCDMVAAASGTLYLVVESMSHSGLNLYRSFDGGLSWQFYEMLSGLGADRIDPAITVPEYTEDYLFVAYERSGQIQVWRVDLQTGESSFTTVGPLAAGHPGLPRIVTDNRDYDEYYVYISYGVTELSRSINRGESWTPLPSVYPWEAYVLVSSDIAYGHLTLYLVQSYVPSGKSGPEQDREGRNWSVVQKSTNDGMSWTNTQDLNGLYSRVAVLRNGTLAMAVSECWVGSDDYIEYAYTADEGVTWARDLILDQHAGVDREHPDIASGETGSNFHVAYLSSGSTVIHRKTRDGDPNDWSSRRIVNDTDQASYAYAPPAVVTDWFSLSSGIAWCDERTPTQAIYFDSTGRPILVSPLGEYHVIQDALSVAEDGDVVELEDTIYSGTGNRDLDFGGKAITLRSQSGSPENCIIDCGGTAQELHRAAVFQNGEGRDAVIENIAIFNGCNAGGGAILCDGASPTISGCYLLINRSTVDGGAISCRNGGLPLVQNCVMVGNSAADDGGVLECRDGSTVELTGCTIQNARAGDSGGAIYCTVNGNVLLNGCTIIECAAPGLGACVSLREGSSATALNTIVAFNEGQSAVHCSVSSADFGCCDVYGNPGGDWVGGIADQLGVDGNICEDPFICSPSTGNYGLHADSPCAAENNPECGQIGSHEVGCAPMEAPGETPALLAPSVALGQILPNPSRSGMTIAFETYGGDEATIEVLDLNGRHVRSLLAGRQTPGDHSIAWDQRDDSGRHVDPGVYFISLAAGDHKESRPVVVIR